MTYLPSNDDAHAIILRRGATFNWVRRALDLEGRPHAFDDHEAELYVFASDDYAGDTPLLTFTTIGHADALSRNGTIALGMAGITSTDTITTVAAAAGATTLTVADIGTAAVGEIVTVALDDGTTFVSKVGAIAGADLSLVTFTEGSPDPLPSAAAGGAIVTVYRANSSTSFAYNIHLYLSETASRDLVPLVGWYRLDIIDDFQRHQPIIEQAFCVAGGK